MFVAATTPPVPKRAKNAKIRKFRFENKLIVFALITPTKKRLPLVSFWVISRNAITVNYTFGVWDNR